MPLRPDTGSDRPILARIECDRVREAERMAETRAEHTAEPTVPAATEQLVLALECENRVGIVAAVARFLADRGCDIVDSQQFDDKQGNRFFMRVATDAPVTGPPGTDADRLRQEFARIAAEFGMSWSLTAAGERMRAVIMVSKEGHCLGELLELWKSGWSNLDIVAVVGNHEELRGVAQSAGLPFHLIPVTSATKPEAEEALLGIVEACGAELVILARYMQILSDGLCERLAGRVINIHHSFLPGFKGARPYHQAWERGVKIVGATAHYVTGDLDEGPIIAQSVFPVDHRATPRELAIAGRRAERTALAQAVAWHTEHRIFINGTRTVIFG